MDPIHPDKIHEYCAQLVDGLSFLHFEKVRSSTVRVVAQVIGLTLRTFARTAVAHRLCTAT